MYITLARPIILILALFGLLACERETYTSWSCNSTGQMKVPMVLRKARMELKELRLDYCGSLGNQSFFDQKCPAVIQNASHVFTPASGELITREGNYECNAL